MEEKRGTSMIIKNISNFNLAQICESGQCFRMNRIGENTYSVIAADKYLEVRQQGEQCFFNCGEEMFKSFWQGYFDLDADYGAYIDKIDPEDEYLTRAASHGNGIRILHQDLWEMIVSFLISQQNNIVRIRRCIQNICERYGEQKTADNGKIYYAFPKPEVLAEATEAELFACNLGYRSKYVIKTAQSVTAGEADLDAIAKMPYEKAREELLKFYGVGVKVADCICLFALHRLEAFPVDTHIKQALDEHYPERFPFERYEGVQGVMQQYIFYEELMKTQWNRKKNKTV